MRLIILRVGLCVATVYALVRLVLLSGSFLKYGGKVWQLVGLVFLLCVGGYSCVLPLFHPAVFDSNNTMVVAQVLAYGCLALASRRIVLIFETCGTSFADKVERVCNTILLVSILAAMCIAAQWYISHAGLVHGVREGL